MTSGEPPARDPFAALGDPNRRAIVELLAEAARSVNEIAGELPISRPAVSRHLKLLKDAGLVVAVAEGTRRRYRLHYAGAEMMARYMAEVWGEAVARSRRCQGEAPITPGSRSPAITRSRPGPCSDTTSRVGPSER